MTVTAEAASNADELHDRFTREVLPFLDQIYRVARGYASNHADAEDLVQEVMVRAYDNFDQFMKGTNIRGWLFRILTNTWINQHRATQRRPNELLTDELTDFEFKGQQSSAVVSASAELCALELLGDNDVKAAMRALPEKQRMVIYYVDVEGFRYHEAAEALEIPLGTVMSRLHRGRYSLRTLLVNKAASCPRECSTWPHG